MNAVIFETVVTAEHQLHYTLPASLPVGCKLRVTVETLADSDMETAAKPSELGRKLLAIRESAIAKGMTLQPLEEILEEVRQGRAEAG